MSSKVHRRINGHFCFANVSENDVVVIGGFVQLQSLDLGFTQFPDLSPLANLSNLKELDLSDTDVSDISPLANLSNLKELRLYGSRVYDVSPLNHLIARGLRIYGP